MKLLLAEDQTMVRNALAALLRLEGDYDVHEVADGQQAQQALQHQPYDVVLTDIEMPNMTGLELLQWSKQHAPATKVVVITTFHRSGYIQRAIQAGADGFILKDAPIEELLQSLQQVLQGQRVIANALLLQSLDHHDPLTERERKALRLAADGHSTAAIATALFIAEGTARNCLSEAMSKLHASNRIEAARIAQRNGWL